MLVQLAEGWRLDLLCGLQAEVHALNWDRMPSASPAVTASGQPVLNETHTSAPDYSRLALLHYVVKSREDFANKVWRGDAMKGPGKGELYWKKINDLSTVTCFDGLHAEQRWRGNTKSHSAASY